MESTLGGDAVKIIGMMTKSLEYYINVVDMAVAGFDKIDFNFDKSSSVDKNTIKQALQGLPWWSNGWDSMLPMQGTRVWSLVGGLDPICHNRVCMQQWRLKIPSCWCNQINSKINVKKEIKKKHCRNCSWKEKSIDMANFTVVLNSLVV